MIRALAVVALLSLACGCGQKGPLKLPDTPAPAVPPSAPAAPPSSP